MQHCAPQPSFPIDFLFHFFFFFLVFEHFFLQSSSPSPDLYLRSSNKMAFLSLCVYDGLMFIAHCSFPIAFTVHVRILYTRTDTFAQVPTGFSIIKQTAPKLAHLCFGKKSGEEEEGKNGTKMRLWMWLIFN